MQTRKIIKAFAGDLEKAHAEGTVFAGELANVEAKPAGIAITSNGGYHMTKISKQ